MMIDVTIEGYLTQRKLADALQQIVGDAWTGNEFKVPGSRRTWDMAYKDDSKIIVVEYDGDEHYCNTIKIKIDREKDITATELGYKVVRFPYWIQLDALTLEHYFGLSANIKQNFPHGFITTKIFPASYCEMGIERYKKELSSLPNSVYNSVISSLQDRVKEYGIEYVLPSSLQYLIDT